jgi:hypothetical protein
MRKVINLAPHLQFLPLKGGGGVSFGGGWHFIIFSPLTGED